MHIEISAGGLGGAIAISEYQSNMSSYLSDAERVISSFKAVTSSTYALNGGVGNLQSAVDELSARVEAEIQKKNDAIAIQEQSNDFLDLAMRVDQQVSVIVEKNKEEFYRVNPWLRPAAAVEETTWYEEAWAWLCGVGEAVADGVRQAWDWVSDTAIKAWNAAVAFYQEHKKVIDTILIVAGAVAAIVAVIATGGVALVPLLGALGVSAATAITISTVVAVVAVAATAVGSILNLIDVWCEIDNPVFNTFQKALNIISTVSNLTYSIGSIYNSIKQINPQQYIAAQQTYDNVSQLSMDQISAITKYTGNDYTNINDSLRGLDTATAENAKTIETMRSVLDHSSLPNDMTLYRGTTTRALGDLQGLSPGELVGKSFVEQGFMSTSTSSTISNAFSGDLHITIEAAKGAHALDISSISQYMTESEVLFSAGQEMLITSAEMIKGILHITVIAL